MLQKIAIPPGVSRDLTQYALEGGGWYDTDKVRFRAGMPEKIGGWTKWISDQLAGIPRSMHVWVTLEGLVVVAIATEKKVYIVRNATLIDITPIRATTTLGTHPITTTSGNANIVIEDSGHGVSVGDYVTISGVVGVAPATNVGGILLAEINKEHVITAVIDANSYRVACENAATSTESDGGTAVVAEYQVGVGPVESAYGTGWGVCQWDVGSWNTARRSCDSILIPGRIWSLDNWGEDLIMNPWGGSVYVWDASSPHARGMLIPEAPTKSQFIIVTDDRHLACFGCNYSADSAEYATGNVDPDKLDALRIQWCDQEDYSKWDIGDRLLTAGDYRVTGGSRLIAAAKIDTITMVWTEEAAHLMQSVDPPLTFRFDQIGTSTGIIAPNAFAVHNGVLVWLGDSSFYRYQGGVGAIVCPVKEYMFDGMDYSRRRKIFAALDRRNDEVSWFYPADDTEPDKYVTYSLRDNIWWIGNMDRTAWIDRGMIEYPIAADENGYLYYHEYGNDADGAALEATLESSDFDLDEGDRLMFIDRFVPDFEMEGDLDVKLRIRYFPHSTNVNEIIGTVEPDTEYINARVRGRQATLIVTSSDIGDKWRMGACRLDIQPDGMKR